MEIAAGDLTPTNSDVSVALLEWFPLSKTRIVSLAGWAMSGVFGNPRDDREPPNASKNDSATPQSASPQDSQSQIGEGKRLLAGLSLIAVLLLLVALMFATTGGDFAPSHWAAFYVSTALITGLAFWLITRSTAKISIPWLGVRLVGGAAVGMAFLLVMLYFFPPTNLRIIEVKVPGVKNEYVTEPVWSPEISKVTKLDDNPQRGVRFLVEFNEGQNAGEFHVTYPKSDGIWRGTFFVKRVGPLPQPNHEKIPIGRVDRR